MKPKVLKYFARYSYGCKSGAFLPKGCANTRNAADVIRADFIPLDHPMIAGNVGIVVAAPPQWAETHSLIRYPSPYGRSCTLWCRPPFFLAMQKKCRHRRALAQAGGRKAIDFDQSARMALNLRNDNQEQKRGFDRCGSHSYLSFRWSRLPAFRHVGTLLANRRSSVPGPVRAQHLWSEATSPAARLSVPGRTSPIARPSQAAANSFRCALTGAAHPTKAIGVHSCAGGFFVANSARNGARPSTE